MDTSTGGETDTGTGGETDTGTETGGTEGGASPLGAEQHVGPGLQ
ncbi:hypothetical protein [Enhygromyxa salina]|nr:hypothetical protein [Enhygromyxa salina]